MTTEQPEPIATPAPRASSYDDPPADPDDLDVIDFDAARREEQDRPIRFKLGGITFTAVAVMPAGAYLDTYGKTDVPLLPFLQSVMEDGEYDRLVARVYDKADPIDVVHLVRVVRKLEAMYSARPTRRPTGSPAGPDATGAAFSSAPGLPVSPTPPAPAFA
jgi:hypothetical protein